MGMNDFPEEMLAFLKGIIHIHGADILRVHDVREARQAVTLYQLTYPV